MILWGAMALNDTVLSDVPYRAVVIDAETKARISDARIVADDITDVRTIWDGSFVIVKPFRQVRISKRGYMTRKMCYEERSDTIALLNDGRCLDEVVVWGNRPRINFDLRGNTHRAPTLGTQPSEMNILGALEHLIHWKKYKRREKAIKVLKDY